MEGKMELLITTLVLLFFGGLAIGGTWALSHKDDDRGGKQGGPDGGSGSETPRRSPKTIPLNGNQTLNRTLIASHCGNRVHVLAKSGCNDRGIKSATLEALLGDGRVRLQSHFLARHFTRPMSDVVAIKV